MLDYYSEYAGPTKEEAFNEIYNILKDKMVNIDNNEKKKIIYHYLDLHLKINNDFGSYSGWIVFIKKDLIKTIMDNYNLINNIV